MKKLVQGLLYIGLAVDTEQGLLVPVIARDPKDLPATLEGRYDLAATSTRAKKCHSMR